MNCRKVYILFFFIGITDHDKYKQKQFLSQVLLQNFVINIMGEKKTLQPPKTPVMEYVCLHHSIIHFCTDRFDKLKYVSNIFFLK